MFNSLQRIFAIFLRQVYIVKRSPPRWISYTFWPTLSMFVWGFFNKYMFTQIGMQQFTFSTLLGASLINNFFERSNVNVMFSFLEDVWAGNIGNILISPIRPLEIIFGYILNGLIAVAIGMSFACVLAYVSFGYNIFEVGVYLIPLAVNLVFSGWCIGIFLISIILRYGASGESLGWLIALCMSPFIAIYYPVTVLPAWLQHISWALPPTYMFESLRELVKTHHFNWGYFQHALLLNSLYFTIGVATFMYQLQQARHRGGLLSMSE